MPALGLAGPHVAILLTYFFDQWLRGGAVDIHKYRKASKCIKGQRPIILISQQGQSKS